MIRFKIVKRRVLGGVFRSDNDKAKAAVEAAIGNLKRLSVLRYSGMQTLRQVVQDRHF